MIFGFASHAAVKFSFSVQWKIKTISLVSMTVTINLYLDIQQDIRKQLADLVNLSSSSDSFASLLKTA